MSHAVRWSQRAVDRFEEAALYFESVREGAGVRFIDEVEATMQLVAHAPMAYPGIPGEPRSTRKVVLPRFGYWIIYEVKPDVIVVLTLWAAVQEPGSWRAEIQDTDGA